MRLYKSVKRLVPLTWKVRYHSTKTLPEDIGARILNRLRGGISIPPRDLIYLVSGHRSGLRFLRRGLLTNKAIRQNLEKNDIEIEHFNAVLDFGCGVGRVMRHWKLRRPMLYGTDYNSTLAHWCKKNLKFADFQVNTLTDRLSYEPQTFDFIYAISVFTHLSEPLQSFWIDELSRVLKPGGYIFFTTHGDYFFSQLSKEEKERFTNDCLVVRGSDTSGSNSCVTFHPKTYVWRNMARDFSVVDFIPGGPDCDLLQDMYLLKKPFYDLSN